MLTDLNIKNLNLTEETIKYYIIIYQVVNIVNNIIYYKNKIDKHLKVIYSDESKNNIIDRISSVDHKSSKKSINRTMNSFYWSDIWNKIRLWFNGTSRDEVHS
jgi:hypothetical protein